MEESLITNWGESLAAGLVGAAALTAVHEIARRFSRDAPRMDVLGERAIARTVHASGGRLPPPPVLRRWALAGDILASSAYYSLVACGRQPSMWRRAVALGLAAGAGALLLPERVGLGPPPRSEHLANQIMTVAWYLLGGLAAAAAGQRIQRAVRAAA